MFNFNLVFKNLSAATGRNNLASDLEAELNIRLTAALSKLSPKSANSYESVRDLLFQKALSDDHKLINALGKPDLKKASDRKFLMSQTANAISPPPGFFLKDAAARRLLALNPPLQLISYLNKSNLDEVLSKFSPAEVFAGMRLLEDRGWMNEVFLSAYHSLTPNDFETRPLSLIVLDDIWQEASRHFVTKKWHNLSHLKELGVIFMMPLNNSAPGELLRTVSLLIHYLQEVPFYSDLIKTAASNPQSFASDLISLLRGDVPKNKPANPSDWLVIQRYLAKDDSADWRLSYPHLNSESWLYRLAEADLIKLSAWDRSLGESLSFWRDLDWVAGYYPNTFSQNKLISFDLLDVVMSLVKRDSGLVYTYHQEEAFWNKIFATYYNFETVGRLIKSNLLLGSFTPPPL